MNFTRALDSLPVLPRCEEADGSPRAGGEFVRERDIARVLLGTTGALPVEGLPAEDFDCFAGRADVRLPEIVKASPSPDSAPVTGIHPAFVPLVEEARRAQAPAVAEVSDMEAAYGIARGKTSDLWWMMGVGVAVAALLFSGALFDAIPSRGVDSGPLFHPAGTTPASLVEEGGELSPDSLASTRGASSLR